MVEFGASTILDSPMTDAVLAMTEEVRRLRAVGLPYGVDLEFVPYDGMHSTYEGGRPSRHSSPLTLQLEIDIFNSHGISYMYAMNGGLSLPRDVMPSEAENSVLAQLHENTVRFNVRNKVTITNGELLPLLRERFPRLEVIASCIQNLEPRDVASYAERFRQYDYVVPLNQHTNAQYLASYKDSVDKMILFLKLRCPNPNLRECHDHYYTMETKLSDVNEHRRAAGKPWSVPGICANHANDASLYARQRDLANLLQMGVTCFKIPRDHPIDSYELEGLVLLYAGTLASRRFEQRNQIR
jgi:hypothetical protein